MHLHRPPLSIGHILTFWATLALFLAFSAACWWGVIRLLMWVVG